MHSWRKYAFLLLDAAVFSAASVVAWFLRGGLDTGLANFETFLPYLLISFSVAVVVFQIFRLHLHFFRFFSIYDLAQMAGATTLAVLLTVLISFFIFRLDNVQRSVPFLHWGFAMAGFILLRMVGMLAGQRQENQALNREAIDRIAALVIGYTSAADLFLRSVPVFSKRHYFIAGILDENPRHLGQRLRQSEVIGHPTELEQTLAQMTIHGVVVRKVILCMDREDLNPESLAEIERLERENRIELHDYAGHAAAFFDMQSDLPLMTKNKEDRFRVPAEIRGRAALSIARYGPLKRGLDILLSLILGTLLLPLMLLILPAIRYSMGSPVVFWQERPGRHGKVFRLYKLRTLSHGVDNEGRVLDDAERQTFVGRLLRRTRLDEIPQLLNVLAGDMSFVGPRPLLPVDLPADLPGWCELRALVRPGLTGWAQVNGGQEVSKEDKVTMDVWYVANMSLWQDIRIVLLTLKTVLRGEKLDRENIRETYAALGVTGMQEGERPQSDKT